MKINVKFQCRTRLCGWCSFVVTLLKFLPMGFNAARGFVGGATTPDQKGNWWFNVSMPHAALWVVQLHRSQPLSP